MPSYDDDDDLDTIVCPLFTAPPSRPTAQSIFDKIDSMSGSSEILDYMKSYFRHILIGKENNIILFPSSREVITFSEKAFKSKFRNKKFAAKDLFGNPTRSVTLGDLYLDSKQRVDNLGFTFDPSKPFGGGRNEPFNKWPGFATEAREGKWDHIQDYLFNVVSNKEDIKYERLMARLSQLINEPEEITGTALVLIGQKGIGKSWLYVILSLLLDGDTPIGEHHTRLCFKTSNPKHLFNKFNEFLRNSCLGNVNEGFWAGNHEHEGILKDLITEKEIRIEIKNGAQLTVRNFIRWLIFANPGWVVPATFDERRFELNEIPNTYQNIETYWNALRDNVRPELSAAMYAIKQFPYQNYNLRTAMVTDALIGQILDSLRGFDKWWYQILRDARLQYKQVNLRDHEYYLVPKYKMYNSFYGRKWRVNDWANVRNETIPLGKLLKEICECDTDSFKLGKEPCFGFRSLRFCRDMFQKKRLKERAIDWEDDEWVKDDPLLDDLQ